MMPTLSEVIAEILCRALATKAVDWHGRRVVFVDDKRDLLAAISEAARGIGESAEPVKPWNPEREQAVAAVIQRNLFTEEGK